MKTLLAITLLSLGLSMSASAKVYDYTSGNKLTLLEDPAKAAEYKMELIRNAKHHINILTFFWDKTALPQKMALELQAANARGVEIRILSTLMASLATDTFAKGRKNLVQKSDAPFVYLDLTPAGAIKLTSSLHEKIFLVDGEKAIIGGRNISNSSLAGKDMEVLMEGEVVNQVQDHFKKMLDFVLEQKIETKCSDDSSGKCEEKFKKLQFAENDSQFFPAQKNYADGVDARILTHEAVVHQSEDHLNRKERLTQQDDILDTVTKIEFKTLRAYNYFMIPTERFRNFIEKNLAEGDSVEFITNSIESAKFSSNTGYIYALPDTLKLLEDGAKIYQWQRNQKLNYVHEKVLIFDDEHVIIGSHNFGTGSTAVSNEIAIEFKSKEIANRLITVFEGEKSNPAITREATPELLESEIAANKFKIMLFRSGFIGGTIRELY